MLRLVCVLPAALSPALQQLLHSTVPSTSALPASCAASSPVHVACVAEFSMFSSNSSQGEMVSVSVSQRMALAPQPPENFEVAVLQYLSQLSQQQASNIK